MRIEDTCYKDVCQGDMYKPPTNVASTMVQKHMSSEATTKQGRLAGVFTRIDAYGFAKTLPCTRTPPGDLSAAPKPHMKKREQRHICWLKMTTPEV